VEGPFRSSAAPSAEVPRRHVSRFVRAQLLIGGRTREIGFAFFAAAAALFCFIAPTFLPTSEVDPDIGGVFIACVFAVLGLGTVVFCIPAARREIRLLRHGTVTPGRIVHVRPGVRAPRQSEYKNWIVTFEFELANGTPYRCRVDVFQEPELGASGLIVYDPRWPDHAASLDHLPGAPAIDDTGRVHLREGRPYGAVIAAAGLALVIAGVIRTQV
jgi:hypothetical protein